MIKIDIANALMKVHPCSRSTALQVVDLLTERLKDALLNGHRIEIRGFGVFEPRPRKRGMAIAQGGGRESGAPPAPPILSPAPGAPMPMPPTTDVKITLAR